MKNYVDVIIGLQHGDESKGKVTSSLCKMIDSSFKKMYDVCLRFNGGANAGHTIYKDGQKYVTHCLPTGVLYGIDSVIGPGCVLEPSRFFKELSDLQIKNRVFIAPNVHIVTADHLKEDANDQQIGTTRSGNGPAYTSKYARQGLLAKDVPELLDFVISKEKYFDLISNRTILCEGAQGIELDVDWGDYPYVTSSHCGVGAAINNGIAFQRIRNVYGVAKCYETYVGTKQFEPGKQFLQQQDGTMNLIGERSVFDVLRDIGNEYGATTGRPRQCNWLNLKRLIRAININGVTHLILSKLDIMRQITTEQNIPYYFYNTTGELIGVYNFKHFIEHAVTNNCPTIQEIIFSDSPYEV